MTTGEQQAVTRVHGRSALLAGLLAGVLCVAFESVAVATAMPRAAAELGGLSIYAWAFTLFVLGMVLSTVVAGRMSDRLGPVRPLALGVALFVVGLLVAGSARSMLVLVLARFVQGMGGGFINLCLMVVVSLVYDERERAAIMTWFSFCWVMPAFLGPPLAALITHHWGWHWVFWSLVPCIVVACLVALRPVLELHAVHAVGAHAAGEPGADPIPLWAAGLGAVGVALVQASGQLLDARATVLWGVLALVGALAALGAGVPRLMPDGFWRMRPGLPAVMWTRAAQAGAFFAGESFMPLSMNLERGFSPFHAGLLLTIGSLGWTVGSWVQSRGWLRLRRDQIVLAGVCATAVGIGAVDLASWFPRHTLAVVATGWVLAGFGMGLAIASTSLAVMALSSQRLMGRNTSSLQTAEGLGNCLVSGAAGTAFHALHQGHAPSTTFGVLFLVAALAAVLACVAGRRIGPVQNASNP